MVTDASDTKVLMDMVDQIQRPKGLGMYHIRFRSNGRLVNWDELPTPLRFTKESHRHSPAQHVYEEGARALIESLRRSYEEAGLEMPPVDVVVIDSQGSVSVVP